MRSAALSRCSATPLASPSAAAPLRTARGIAAASARANAASKASNYDAGDDVEASPTATSTSTSSSSSTSSPAPSRRGVLFASAASVTAASLGLSSPPSASAQIRQLNTFTVDLLPHFELQVPPTWTTADAEVPGAGSANRPTRVWYPSDDPSAPGSVNVTLTATMVGADFTSLGSFGDASTFGESLVATMDRGFAGGPTARLVSAKEASRTANDKTQKVYEIEYAVTRSKAEGERLFVSAVALSFDGIYNRLYTVTGQFAAGEAAEKHGKEVAAIVKSFVPPATRV